MPISTEETPEERYLSLLSAAYEEQRASTAEILRSPAGWETIHRLMEDATARAEQSAEVALAISPPARAIACREGCGHCCWSTVGVIAPEALYLAGYLRATLPQAGFAAVREEAAGHAGLLQSMEHGARLRARVPCALLRDDACSAYRHRPLACRWACSPSLNSCLDHLVHQTTTYLEMEDVRYQPIQEVWRGNRDGVREAGLDASLLALNSALAVALADPDAGERYLSGEPIFEVARLD